MPDKKLWLFNNKLVTENNKVIECDHCPCGCCVCPSIRYFQMSISGLPSYYSFMNGIWIFPFKSSQRPDPYECQFGLTVEAPQGSPYPFVVMRYIIQGYVNQVGFDNLFDISFAQYANDNVTIAEIKFGHRIYMTATVCNQSVQKDEGSGYYAYYSYLGGLFHPVITAIPLEVLP